MIRWCNSSAKVMGVAKHYLIGVMAHSTGWSPCLTLFEWPTTRDYKGPGSRGKPNTTVLLKEQSNKEPLNGILLAILTDQCLAQLSSGIPSAATDGNKYRDHVQKVRGFETLHPE